MAARVLVVGHVTHDRYGDSMMAGGSAYYGALGYQHLGADVHLRCGVGNDFALEAALAPLHCTLSRGGLTTVFTNLYPVEGPRLQLLEAQAPEVLPEALPATWLSADLLHLAPVIGEVDLERWKGLSRARLLGISVQGYIKQVGPAIDSKAVAPARGHRVVQKPWTVTVDELRGIDVACASDEDLIGQGDLLSRMRAAIPIVALTHGERGATIFHRSGVTQIGVVPNVIVTDATGAGDLFAAGFLHALTCYKTVEEAAQLGAAAASIVIEALGAAALPRLHEASARAHRVAVSTAAE